MSVSHLECVRVCVLDYVISAGRELVSVCVSREELPERLINPPSSSLNEVFITLADSEHETTERLVMTRTRASTAPLRSPVCVCVCLCVRARPLICA